MQRIPGIEERVVLFGQTGIIDDGVQLLFEGMPLGSYFFHARVIDGDGVIKGLLRGINAVGLFAQTRVGGQGNVSAGVHCRTKGTEDSLDDQQVIQVGLAQRALWQILKSGGNKVGEQTHSAAPGSHALHGGPLPLQFSFLGDEGPFQPFQNARYTVVAVCPTSSLAGSCVSAALVDRSCAASSRPSKRITDVVQGNSGVSHLADPQQLDHLFVAVAAAVVTAPLGFRQQTDRVIVTDRPRCNADEGRSVTDLHLTRGNEGRDHEQDLPWRSGM